MLQPLRLEWWDAADLKENPRNWRRHSPAQESSPRQFLAEVGWAGAALWIIVERDVLYAAPSGLVVTAERRVARM